MDWLKNNNRAIAIPRVSGFGQKDNTSRTTQTKLAREYCEDVGLDLVKIFEIVETASKADLRKKYNAARKWALANNIRHIIFLVYDREARNLKDNEENEILVRADKIVLHYAQERKVLWRDSPDSDFFIRDVSAVTNKHYSRVLSTKVRAATKTKAEFGWYPGTWTPDGYIHKKLKDENGKEFRRRSVIILDPNELTQKRVLREFELRALKLSLYEIRKQIIADKLVPLGERISYHVSGIERRLKNKFYNGRFDWQGQEYEGKHELFISYELFWKVQATFGLRNGYIRKSEGVFGGGWLKCANGDCACHVVYDPKTKKLKGTGEMKVYKLYHCTNGKKIHPTMRGMNASEENLFEQFGDAVDSISISETFAGQIADALSENQRKSQRALDRQMESYKTALTELEEAEDEAYKDLKRQILDDEGYHRQLKRIRSDRARYTGLLHDANKNISNVGFENAKSILELVTNAKSLWEKRTPQERKVFLDKLLSNQWLDGSTVRYEMNKPFVSIAKMKGNEEWRRERDSNPR